MQDLPNLPAFSGSATLAQILRHAGRALTLDEIVERSSETMSPLKRQLAALISIGTVEKVGNTYRVAI